MRNRGSARFVNGVVSAFIVVFFLVHGSLGAISAFTGFSSPLSWLVWCGVAIVSVHVIVSVVTSWQQLNDAEHPPSARKKRHLILKWVTGSLLAVVAGTHIVAMHMWGAAAVQSQVSGALLMVVLAVVLAVHLCVGSKSLLKDLEIDRRYKTAFRIVVCVFAAAFALSGIVGLFIS